MSRRDAEFVTTITLVDADLDSGASLLQQDGVVDRPTVVITIRAGHVVDINAVEHGTSNVLYSTSFK